MNMERLLAESTAHAEALRAGGGGIGALDRVNDNPEAARYFLAYADWHPVDPAEIFAALEAETGPAEVYVDFPFCPTVCTFCAFYPVIPRAPSQVEAYAHDLQKEIALLGKLFFRNGRLAESLELGGGTPTFLPFELLRDVVDTLRATIPFVPGSEQNFETTPECILGDEGTKKLHYLRSAGFTRISIGAQSFDDRVLRSAHRSHLSAQIYEALENARAASFSRINFDILYGLLDQTIESFLESIETSIALDIDIIEIYTMRYFDTKRPVPLTRSFMESPDRFVSASELLIGRVAADRLLRDAGYVSPNGRTYYRPQSHQDYYAGFYRGSFEGHDVLGIGRKSHSNLRTWQYANYRDLEKYSGALAAGRLPIAAGCRVDRRAALGRAIIGGLQLPGPFDYGAVRAAFDASDSQPFDRFLERCADTGLLADDGWKLAKTELGFFFIEEVLKGVYDCAVTPFGAGAPFLGKAQTRYQPAVRR